MSKNKQAIYFLPDAPYVHFDPQKSAFAGDDAARCEPLAEQLAQQLRSFFNQSGNTNHPKQLTAPRIGVFGGLGQGKTTVIHWALYKAEIDEGKYVEWFNTAHYKSDDLEYEFDRLLGGGSINDGTARFIALLACIFLALGVIFYNNVNFSIIYSNVTFTRIILAFIVGLIAWWWRPIRYWWRSGQRT